VRTGEWRSGLNLLIEELALFSWIQPKVRSSRLRSSGARRLSPRAVVERLFRKAFQ
jgi:hypothetical protein